MARHVPVLLAALALLAITTAFACAGPRAAARATAAVHPDVGPQDGTADCGDCHAQATPALYRAWEDSPHGVAMVKCLVCHGARDALAKAPAPARCQGCHAAQVASAPPAASCFSCHAPHTLAAEAKPNPHQK